MSSTCKIKMIRKSDIKISKNTFEYSDNFTDIKARIPNPYRGKSVKLMQILY